MIVNLVEQIGKRSYTVARRCFTIVSVIFGHGQAKHLATPNPCAGLKLRAILGKRKPTRETKSLTEKNLREVFAKLPAIGKSNALAIKIILACAVHKVEMRLTRPENLDFDAGVWTIPATHSKNGKEFQIPLPPVVVDWFQELLAMAAGNEWILPGMDRKRPISASTLNVALDRLGVDIEFTVHDLRRTARTHLTKLGVDIITAEKCLNHTLGGLIDVYDRGDY